MGMLTVPWVCEDSSIYEPYTDSFGTRGIIVKFIPTKDALADFLTARYPVIIIEADIKTADKNDSLEKIMSKEGALGFGQGGLLLAKALRKHCLTNSSTPIYLAGNLPDSENYKLNLSQVPGVKYFRVEPKQLDKIIVEICAANPYDRAGI